MGRPEARGGHNSIYDRKTKNCHTAYGFCFNSAALEGVLPNHMDDKQLAS